MHIWYIPVWAKGFKKGPKFAVNPESIPVKYISTTYVAALQAGERSGVDCSSIYHNVSRILNTYTST